MAARVSLEEAIATRELFQPVPRYIERGDYLTLHFENVDTYCDRVDDVVSVFRSLETDEIKGCLIKGVSLLAKRCQRMNILITDENIELSVLLLSAIGHSPDAEELYYDLSNLCGKISIPIRPILDSKTTTTAA